ncbi:hypothetical protein BS78_K163300 [Paspalum vaginatum]|uniref:Uncharacterized protein n=1 Tax=Paspalum vaginatum TaxID=158149 RepID=A0A9W8CDL4_9POAL|nr:hypothetical protein BS78_K163300 [Paspalum vaginatum]
MSLPQAPKDWEETNDDDGEQESQPAKRHRCSGCGEAKQMLLLEEMRTMMQKQNEKMESMFRENQDLREKISCLMADISRLDGYLQKSPAPGILSDQQCSTPLRLKFLNSCKNDKYSKHKIEADDKTPLKVAIFNHKNEIITSEPFSSMRVHVVPIQGDFDNDHKGQWTEKHFCSKIVSGRPGKGHLLSGDLYIRLQNGVGYLNAAKFQDNSSFVASKRFKLGVMAADERISQRIQEGISDSFAVKDVRGYSTKKNLNPSPCDPVYKLCRIAKDGDRHKFLEQNGIKTVKDFVLSYNQSHEDLRKILGKISDQDWDMVINHAQKCNPRPANHELETISRSDGSCYLKGSSSMQPNPAPQNQVRVQVMHQQSSSTYSELSSGVSLDDAPREEEQVSGVGNEVLSVPLVDNSTLEGSNSRQGCSSDYKTMLDGNAEPHVISDPFFWDWMNSIEDPVWEGSCNAFEQSGGRTPASEAGSCGSLMARSPVRTARGTRRRRFSSSPARGASSSSYWARPAPPLLGADLLLKIWGDDLAAPQICQDNLSNAGTDFTDEEFLDFTDEEFLDFTMR